MAARTVAVRLTAEVASYIQGMKNAAAATKDLATSSLETAQKNRQAFTDVGQAVLAVGAATGVGVGMAVKSFADFDAAMSGVQAATHGTAGEMHSLGEAALEAGARTSFSATEAADAIEQLAKAGISTADILGGGLDGALDLAAAGGLAVGDAAEIAATALTQFRLAGQEVPHVADLLAAAAGKAQGDVSDMGMALKQAGLVASQTGLSIEETTAGLASFASAGLLGSDAGTSFKSMLQRLTPQSVEAANLMDRLGISAYDAQGNFIGLEAFAGNLQDSLSGLTVEQRNSAMATIFGSDAVRAASVLYQQGASGIADWTEKVNDQGYAAETAAIKLDNLKGDVEELSGSVETALIKTGAAGDDFARGAVQGATALVNAYNDMPSSAQTAALSLGAVVSAASLASGAFLVLAPRIAATRAAMATLNTEMPRTTAAMTGLGKVAGVAAALTAASIGADLLVDAIADAPPGLGSLTNSLAEFVQTGRATGDLAKMLGQDFDDLAGKLDVADLNKYLGTWRDAGTWFGGTHVATETARRDLEALDQALAGLVGGGNTEQASQAFDAMAAAVEADGGSIDELRSRLPGYTDAIAAAEAQTSLAADAQGELGSAVAGATGEVVGQTQSLAELMEQVQALSNQVLGLRGAERDFQAAIDEAAASVAENGRTLDINTEKGRANEAALDAIASSANDVLNSMVEAGQPIDAVSAKMAEQRGRLIDAARAFGMTEEQAGAFADEVLRIPTARTTTITVNGVKTAITDVGNLATYLQALRDKTITVTTRRQDVIGSQLRVAGVTGPGGYADGGWVHGPGGPREDRVLARLSPREFVVNADSASRHGPLLEAINANRFADGGWASGRSFAAAPLAGSAVATGPAVFHLYDSDGQLMGTMRGVAAGVGADQAERLTTSLRKNR